MWTDRGARRAFWTGVLVLLAGFASLFAVVATVARTPAPGADPPDTELPLIGGTLLLLAGNALMILGGWRDVRARRAAERAAERAADLRRTFS